MTKHEAYQLVLHRGKPHGFKGQIKFQFAHELQEEFIDIEHLYVLQNGEYIPYFVEELSYQNEKYCIIKLEDINDDKNKIQNLYISSTDIENYIIEEEEDYYAGFEASDINHGILGSILRIEELPAQELAVVLYNNKEMMIPMVDEYIVSIDETKKTILFNLPDGYLEIYK
jgi:16S rRNA processing protein RimM